MACTSICHFHKGHPHNSNCMWMLFCAFWLCLVTIPWIGVYFRGSRGGVRDRISSVSNVSSRKLFSVNIVCIVWAFTRPTTCLQLLGKQIKRFVCRVRTVSMPCLGKLWRWGSLQVIAFSHVLKYIKPHLFHLSKTLACQWSSSKPHITMYQHDWGRTDLRRWR